MKLPVIIQPAYTVYFERLGDMTFTHCDVHYWSASVYKELYQAHGVLQMLHTNPFYTLTDNPKLEEFVTMLGYQYLETVPCGDGTPRKMWRFK